MENAYQFKSKLEDGHFCLGTCISFTDPTVTDALATGLDFLWIDAEHNAFSNETLQLHALAARARQTPILVRVPWNDPVTIKPILDTGVDGIFIPQIRTADDVRDAVAACRYPPEGIRGYGPRVPSNYGRDGGQDYIQRANESLIVIVQIEHVDAVDNIESIVEVPGLTAVLLGPNDLSGSMGLLGQPYHPKVVEAVGKVIDKALAANKFPGLAMGCDPKGLLHWTDMGIRWLSIGGDFLLMVRAFEELADLVMGHLQKPRSQGD